MITKKVRGLIFILVMIFLGQSVQGCGHSSNNGRTRLFSGEDIVVYESNPAGMRNKTQIIISCEPPIVFLCDQSEIAYLCRYVIHSDTLLLSGPIKKCIYLRENFDNPTDTLIVKGMVDTLYIDEGIAGFILDQMPYNRFLIKDHQLVPIWQDDSSEDELISHEQLFGREEKVFNKVL